MKRRDLLKTLAGGGALLAARGLGHASTATTAPSRRLDIVSRTIAVNGKPAKVFGLAQPDGSLGLELDTATGFDVTLTNRIAEPSLIHWHGLTPPWALDGVPDNPQPLLQPGETRGYRFPLARSGTYWMHAHTLQEQNLLAAPLIVHDAADRAADLQEVVILLHDFSFTPATELLARLQGSAAPAMPGMDMSGTSMPGMDMSGMKMSGMGAADVNDIDYDAYLANDRGLDDPQVVRVERGGMVRLRIINGATGTAFTIATGTPSATLIAVDGQPVTPLRGRSFPVAMGQRLDILLALPQAGGSFPILALREGAVERTGIILATAGAAVSRIASGGSKPGPAVGLGLESRLRAAAPLPERTADRKFALDLSGTMAPYAWSMGSGPLRVRHGERIEIALRNRSMMTHPIHLHGHRFQVVAIAGQRLAGAVRDTVIVPAMTEVTIAFDADNPGHWPLHCHHLYHMATGMMTYVAYDGTA